MQVFRVGVMIASPADRGNRFEMDPAISRPAAEHAGKHGVGRALVVGHADAGDDVKAPRLDRESGHQHGGTHNS